MALSLGGLLARANFSSHQAEVRAKEQQALVDELTQVKEQMDAQVQRFFIQEAALTEALGDENQIKEVFINGGRGHPPSHLKFFLLVFSKLKEDIK